ncbi:gametocyte-specific factor 1-like isoform X1 [Cyprinus carpio]|uniref:Gametocyte-specific factor 1-like isoform X1 n=2 Tax=Cyprinus carpio TaxID=7962 RepID=A0A9Q9ZQI0_CYPCA|nr:gametocyte-specific factor 1-like isoform X1 [Cyprinus carpio]
MVTFYRSQRKTQGQASYPSPQKAASMASVRFGSSVGASGVSSDHQQHGWNEEDAYGEDPDDAGDPNRLVQCPYDKNHQIIHVLKCRKNHPKLASELKTCPFNARHLIPKHELSHHIANCEDKRTLNAEDGNVELLEKFQVPVNTCANPSSYEDWETEADDNAAMFVWGASNNQLAQNKPEPSTTISLSDGLRAPRTLPWKL